MHRMRRVFEKIGLCSALITFVNVAIPTRADLIRPQGSRTYPEIAGDIVGHQTYSFDPRSQTGTFELENAPHVISLGPAGQSMINLKPNVDGTLSQKLQIKLDRNGRLVEAPENDFQVHGTVVIGDQVYQGLLLQGKPTGFGAKAQAASALGRVGAFDLDLEITGGELAKAFGKEAYFRIIPQSNSTFQGDFGSSFSSERPLTKLRATAGNILERPVPEPPGLIILVCSGFGFLIIRRLGNVSGLHDRNRD